MKTEIIKYASSAGLSNSSAIGVLNERASQDMEYIEHAPVMTAVKSINLIKDLMI